jgi:hypothetical protein
MEKRRKRRKKIGVSGDLLSRPLDIRHQSAPSRVRVPREGYKERKTHGVALEAGVAVVHLATAGLAVSALTRLVGAGRTLAERLVASAETRSSSCANVPEDQEA